MGGVGGVGGLEKAADFLLVRISSGLVVITLCSSSEARMRMATWFWPAKKIPSPTSADNKRRFSPSDK